MKVFPQEVEERLELLRTSGQIAELTYERVQEQITQLIKANKINPQNDAIGSMTSHLAVAAERMNRGEPVSEMTTQMEEVIEKNPDLYELAERVIDECLWKEGATKTKAEIGFMTLYLATLQR